MQSPSQSNRMLVQVSKLFAMSATTAITAFISPYIEDRDIARKLHDEAGLPFIEVSPTRGKTGKY